MKDTTNVWKVFNKILKAFCEKFIVTSQPPFTYSKLIGHWRCSGVFLGNFKHISYLALIVNFVHIKLDNNFRCICCKKPLDKKL